MAVRVVGVAATMVVGAPSAAAVGTAAALVPASAAPPCPDINVTMSDAENNALYSLLKLAEADPRAAAGLLSPRGPECAGAGNNNDRSSGGHGEVQHELIKHAARKIVVRRRSSGGAA